MKWWPHNEPKLTSAPVVVACCLIIGAAVAFSPGLSTKERLVAFLAGPAFFFSMGWFLASLILRIVGHLRVLAFGFFYFGLAGVLIGSALVLGSYLGLSLEPSERMAADWLQLPSLLGAAVAAKQSLDRRGLPGPKEA